MLQLYKKRGLYFHTKWLAGAVLLLFLVASVAIGVMVTYQRQNLSSDASYPGDTRIICGENERYVSGKCIKISKPRNTPRPVPTPSNNQPETVSTPFCRLQDPVYTKGMNKVTTLASNRQFYICKKPDSRGISSEYDQCATSGYEYTFHPTDLKFGCYNISEITGTQKPKIVPDCDLRGHYELRIDPSMLECKDSLRRIRYECPSPNMVLVKETLRNTYRCQYFTN